MAKVNYRLLPIKAHYFFFFAGMGPVLPFLPVFGKHLGVSEVVVGSINAAIPLICITLKPFLGYLIDYFRQSRKTIFMAVLLLTGVFFFFLMGFIPDNKAIIHREVNFSDIRICSGNVQHFAPALLTCENSADERILKDESLYCSVTKLNGINATVCKVSFFDNGAGLYSGFSFWSFVFLMSFGSIGYNIFNSMSDAICFDVLGEGNEMLFGKQRVWGTAGFGIAALIGGYFMSLVDSKGLSTIEDFFPASCLCGVCILVDLACCHKLKLPPLPKSESIVNDVWGLVKQPHIATFLCFTVLVGVCDSSIIFYLLWYLEDLAKESGKDENMKLLQGLTIAVETIGEVVAMYFSGKVLRKIGYGHCLSLCFFFYSLRLILIAIIPSPWWILLVELFMQGLTYALCYTTIVAYASAVSPPGTSATMQGIVGGMDDGIGFSIGNLVSSMIYKVYGGRLMFISMAILAFSGAIVHTFLYILFFRHTVKINKKEKVSNEKQLGAINDAEIEATVPLN